MRSESPELNDGVNTGRLDTSQNHTHRSPRLIIPSIGTKNNPLNLDRDHEGEENLTDDAIKEMDYDFNRINPATRASPSRYYEGMS